MRSANIKYTLMRYFLPLVLVMITGITEVKGQVYANSQTNKVNGLCVLCGVENPGRAIDENDLTNYSEFTVTLGLLGITVEQTLIFPSINPNLGCDEIVIRIGNSSSILSANLLGGVKIETLNGTTSNNDGINITDNILTLLGGGNQADIKIKPAANFDRVKISLSSALLSTSLGKFRLFYAARTSVKPSLATIPAQSICLGQSINLAPLNPVDNNNISGGTYTWSTTAGGAALPSTTVSPTTTTSYSVRYQKDNCYDDKSVTITVYPKPHPPPIKPLITNN